MSQFIPIAKLAQLQDKKGQAVAVRGRLIALFLCDGRVHAIDDACPHMGGPLSEGLCQQGVVICPWHGWRFDIANGAWLDTGRKGVNSYLTKIENGIVYLDANW